MSRHLNNLERLCNDLSSRFGDLDPMVQQVKAEVESCKVNEENAHKPNDRAIPYRTWVKDRHSQLKRPISS